MPAEPRPIGVIMEKPFDKVLWIALFAPTGSEQEKFLRSLASEPEKGMRVQLLVEGHKLLLFRKGDDPKEGVLLTFGSEADFRAAIQLFSTPLSVEFKESDSELRLFLYPSQSKAQPRVWA